MRASVRRRKRQGEELGWAKRKRGERWVRKKRWAPAGLGLLPYPALFKISLLRIFPIPKIRKGGEKKREKEEEKEEGVDLLNPRISFPNKNSFAKIIFLFYFDNMQGD